jgi:SAM-dependent methyltransferase
VCGATGSRERFVSPDLLHSVPGRFRYVECGACETVYQNPRVVEQDLPLCYPAGYFTHEAELQWSPRPAPPGSLRDLLKRAIRHAADGVPDPGLTMPVRLLGRVLAQYPPLRRRARLGLIDGLAPPHDRRGRCLEVGPGQGFDLFCLRSLGWEACGLEVDPVAAARARERSGCEVRVGTLASTDYPPRSFDLVYMSHVVEHLPDPGSSLRRCLELLAPDGRLVLAYPNPGALSARLHGPLSVVWDPPRHLFLPPPAAMTALLERIGFADVGARVSAPQAAVNSEAARRRRRGERWDPLRLAPPGPIDRLFGLLEAALVGVGLPVGEEVLVSASRAAASRAA